MKVNHPNILHLSHFASEKPNQDNPFYTLSLYYVYPKNFINNRHFYNKRDGSSFTADELVSIGIDTIKAVNHLKKNKKIHGDIRPLYLGESSEDEGKFLLMDRLNNMDRNIDV